MANWRDHVPEAERGWLVEDCDDGSATFPSRYSGGAAPEGLWGSLSLMRVEADGTTTLRDFRAEGDWKPLEIQPA